MSGSLKAKSHKNSSNKDDNDIRLLPIKAGKKPRIVATNRKLGSGNLSSTLTKLVLGIGQDKKAKKVFTPKTS